MNLGSNDGFTGFHVACINGNLKVAEFLVQQGFDMNAGDHHGCTGFIVACAAGNLSIIWFLLHHGFKNINDFSIDMTALDILIDKRFDFSNDELYMPCILLLIEAGGEVSEEYDDFEELNSAIQNRIIEITVIKKNIDKKWTGRIAQLINDFTMEPFTDTSLQNLTQFLNHDQQPTRTICFLF
jgi:ankyrin repeat protein